MNLLAKADLSTGVCKKIQFKSSKRSYYNSKVLGAGNRDTEQRGGAKQKRYNK